MANLGICRGCDKCLKISPALEDDQGKKLSLATSMCSLVGVLTWTSEVPEGCPFSMEHMVTMDSVYDLVDEAQKSESESEVEDHESEFQNAGR